MWGGRRSIESNQKEAFSIIIDNGWKDYKESKQDRKILQQHILKNLIPKDMQKNTPYPPTKFILANPGGSWICENILIGEGMKSTAEMTYDKFLNMPKYSKTINSWTYKLIEEIDYLVEQWDYICSQHDERRILQQRILRDMIPEDMQEDIPEYYPTPKFILMHPGSPWWDTSGILKIELVKYKNISGGYDYFKFPKILPCSQDVGNWTNKLQQEILELRRRWNIAKQKVDGDWHWRVEEAEKRKKEIRENQDRQTREAQLVATQQLVALQQQQLQERVGYAPQPSASMNSYWQQE